MDKQDRGREISRCRKVTEDIKCKAEGKKKDLHNNICPKMSQVLNVDVFTAILTRLTGTGMLVDCGPRRPQYSMLCVSADWPD